MAQDCRLVIQAAHTAGPGYAHPVPVAYACWLPPDPATAGVDDRRNTSMCRSLKTGHYTIEQIVYADLLLRSCATPATIC